MNYEPDIIQTPSGRFIFVGQVPTELAYIWEHEDDLRNAVQVGPGMARTIAQKHGRIFCKRSFATKDDAEAALKLLG